jgi:hypothetical protein
MTKWLLKLKDSPYHCEASPDSWVAFSKQLHQAVVRTHPDQVTKSSQLLLRTDRELSIHYDVILDIEHRYLAFRFARIIMQGTPGATHNQRITIFKCLFKSLRKLHGNKQHGSNFVQGMVYPQDDEAYVKEVQDFRDQIAKSLTSWHIKAPAPIRAALEADFAVLPPELTGYLNSLDSLPDELLQPSISWENLPELTVEGANLLRADIPRYHSHILALHDYATDLINRAKRPFFQAQAQMDKGLDDAELHYYLYHLWGQHYWGSFSRQLSTLHNSSPLVDISDNISRLFRGHELSIPLLQYRPFWHTWLLAQYNTNPEHLLNTCQACYQTWTKFRSKGVLQWDQMRFPLYVFHVPRLEALMAEAEAAQHTKDIAYVLEVWAFVFEELMCQSTHMDNFLARAKYRKARIHVYNHYQSLCHHFPQVLQTVNITHEHTVTYWEDYEVEHAIELDQKFTRAQRETCSRENAEALAKWSQPKEPEAPDTALQEEESEAVLHAVRQPIRVSYCSSREPADDHIYSIQPKQTIPDEWSKWLRKVQCPKAMEPVSLWNAICFYSRLSEHDLAMLPYDDEVDGTRWKKIKRGSLRLFFHTTEHTTYLHVMQRRDWSYVA